MSHRLVLEPERRDARPGRHGRWAVLIALVVVVALAGGVFLGLRGLVAGLRGGPADYPGPGTGEVVVTVQPGDSATAIARELERAGVVKSVSAFTEAARNDPRSTRIQPGSYRLRLQMRAVDALALMLDPASRVQARVVLPEGLRLAEALQRLADGSRLPLADFQAAARNPAALGVPAYAKAGLEGFVFPATYDVAAGESAQALLTATVKRYDQAAAQVQLEARANAMGRTPYEVLIVASLVQAEARAPGDFGKVARVIYNRLAAGRKLEFDSTVNYALGRSEIRVTNKDLQVDSPYNTYKFAGLPPGPIDAPGQQALEAALNPTPGDWLFFVTVNPTTGETKFTASEAEFLQFKAELQRNLG